MSDRTSDRGEQKVGRRLQLFTIPRYPEVIAFPRFQTEPLNNQSAEVSLLATNA
jgi:hypothetical protein